MTTPRTYGGGLTWPTPCEHPTTTTRHYPASGGYDSQGRSYTTPARDVTVCAVCGVRVGRADLALTDDLNPEAS